MSSDESELTLYVNMLRSSIKGRVLEIEVGDPLEGVMRALGLSHVEFVGDCGRGFFEHKGAEISVGFDGLVSMVYVEIPDHIPMHFASYLEDAVWRESSDPDVLETNIGKSHVVIDRRTGNVMSFAI